MLVESPSRTALQQFLNAWQAVLHSTRQGPDGKGLIRWAIDVDPLAIPTGVAAMGAPRFRPCWRRWQSAGNKTRIPGSPRQVAPCVILPPECR